MLNDIYKFFYVCSLGCFFWDLFIRKLNQNYPYCQRNHHNSKK